VLFLLQSLSGLVILLMIVLELSLMKRLVMEVSGFGKELVGFGSLRGREGLPSSRQKISPKMTTHAVITAPEELRADDMEVTSFSIVSDEVAAMLA